MTQKQDIAYFQSLFDGFGLKPGSLPFLTGDNQAALEQAMTAAGLPPVEAEPSPLASIVASVGDGVEAWQLPVARLSLGNAVLPDSEAGQPVAQLLAAAKSEITSVADTTDRTALAYSLFHLAHVWGARLSAPSTEHQDVSLFDRNRLLAAVAVCQAQCSGEQQNAFLLVRGDFSGIQEFIYTDVEMDEPGNTRKLAKRLRGRSFFVALLTDYIAEEIVREFGLEMANIIYTGGGQFTMLLPALEDITGQLDQFSANFNQLLRKKVGPKLHLLIAAEPCNESIFQDSTDYLLRVNQKLETQKLRRYALNLPAVFHPAESVEIDRGNMTAQTGFYDDEWLGNAAPYANYLVEIHAEAEPLRAIVEADEEIKKASVVTSLASRGAFFFMLRKSSVEEEAKAIAELLGRLQDVVEFARVIRLNHTDFLEHRPLFKDIKTPVGFGFRFVGKEAPLEDASFRIVRSKVTQLQLLEEEREPQEAGDDLLSFEELAYLNYYTPDEPLGFPQIGAMRLDVDDLGAIFGFGLNPNTLLRLAAMSREFHLFFSGYFNLVARQFRLYVTYSGGDDAFVIGSWYNILHFARALQYDFEMFTCQNPEVTLSAGIFFCDEHHPIAKMAEDAGKLEGQSKDFPGIVGGMDKNAVTVFGKTMTWSRFEEMMEFAEILEGLVGWGEKKGERKNNISRSLVHHLLSTIRASRGDENEMKFYKNVALLHNMFARDGYNKKKLDQERRKLEESEHPEEKTVGGYFIPKILREFANRDTFEDYVLPFQYVLYRSRELRD